MTAASDDSNGVGSGNGPAPLSRLPRWAVPVACLGLVVAAALALTVVATSSKRGAHHGPSTAPGSGASAPAGSGPGAPTIEAVQALLDRHGADVLRRDRRAFLDDLDTGAGASAYRTAQAAMFDNLADVPLAAWTYRVSAPVTAGSALSDAAARYHAPVLIARIAFSYQLRGFDLAPTEHDIWLTFVRRSGQARIVSDSDLVDQGGQSWHGPWDFGPVGAYRGARCLVLAHPAYATRVAGLAAEVDAAVGAVTAVWGPGWARQAVVFVPDSADELRAVLGGPTGSASTDVAAQTLGDPSNPRAGVRVVLDPTAQTQLSPLGLRIVLRHELSHVAAWTVTTDAMPTWLVEGFADYVGNLNSGQSVPVAAAELRALVRAGRVPAALPTGTDFADAGSALPRVYEQAWLACRLIATLPGTGGSAGLVRLYRLAAPPGADFDDALRTVVHMSLAQFTARWRQYLQAELR